MKLINKGNLKSALLAVMVYIFLVFENKKITVSNYTINAPKADKKYNGFKIVHISDLQNASFGKRNKRLIKIIKNLKPGIIVVTGDIVDCHKTDVYCALNFAHEISQVCPSYYVCGNHEGVLGNYQKLSGDLVKAGFTVLNNESVYYGDDKKIRITGLTDPYLGYIKDMGQFLKKQIAKDNKVLNIVLSHRPQFIDMYANSKSDIVFSGHAHGGQIRLPFIGGLFAPDQGLFPKYTKGVHKIGNTQLVISRGLGNSVFPQRLFNRPEVVCVKLKID